MGGQYSKTRPCRLQAKPFPETRYPRPSGNREVQALVPVGPQGVDSVGMQHRGRKNRRSKGRKKMRKGKEEKGEVEEEEEP